MRDNSRTAEYWESKIRANDHDIEEDELFISEKKAANEIDSKQAKTAYMLLSGEYLIRAWLNYSAGRPIEEIAEVYLPLVETMEAVWTKQSSYLDMLWALSLGIMIDAPLESFRKLEALVVREEYADHLLDFLFRSVDPEWDWETEKFRMKQPYSTLEPLLSGQAEDPAAFLREYLEKRWYKPHRQMAWYDSHKRNDYIGYWSFESGAIAKILKIDDSGMKDTPYYPYDLVHFCD